MTQEEKVLSYLKEGNTLTCMTAFNYLGITQVAARIFTLKQKGHPINKRTVQVPTRYENPVKIAEYYYGEPKEPVQGSLDL